MLREERRAGRKARSEELAQLKKNIRERKAKFDRNLTKKIKAELMEYLDTLGVDYRKRDLKEVLVKKVRMAKDLDWKVIRLQQAEGEEVLG